ncbi:MAG: NAD(+)/NADH kinase [Anaerolineae bacterium]|nr:NAD(+)/NADH kinase [Anaerolineales bacterium]MCQ3978846.1 NAD(+) kinase [Anaerolineae bacterium]
MAPNTPPLAFCKTGLLYHPKLAESRVMAAEMLEFIEGLGASAWVSSSWDEADIKERLDGLDLLITLGGDGSLLRAARVTAHRTIPILGINMGRLGFLVEVQPAEWPERIRQTLLGDCWIEERMLLRAEHYHEDQVVNTYEALNEVVIGRGQFARVVRLRTEIDGVFLTTYTADGVILATATGSTAYALAAGGPILPPELENFLLVPLAPHLSLERAIVLSKGVTVSVQISTDYTAVLTVDGQFEVELADQDKVVMRASPAVARFVRLQDKSYFYRTLMQRLGWPQKRK